MRGRRPAAAVSSHSQLRCSLILQGQCAAAMGGKYAVQQLAAMGQQSAAAMGARGGHPLTWGSAPPGSGYGPQTPPMTMGYWGGVLIPMPAHAVACARARASRSLARPSIRLKQRDG